MRWVSLAPEQAETAPLVRPSVAVLTPARLEAAVERQVVGELREEPQPPVPRPSDCRPGTQ